MSMQERNHRRAKYFQDFMMLFKNESDRGCVIISAALLDDVLLQLLKGKLIPTTERKDELFEDGSSALSTFSSRIDFAYRLGLIRQDAKLTFHLIRKIRNDCAHVSSLRTFDISGVKNRVIEIFNLNKLIIDSFSQLLMDENIIHLDRQDLIETLGLRKSYEFLISAIAAFLLEALYDIERIKPSYQS